MFNDWRLKKGPIVPRSKSINDGLSIKSIKSELSDSDDLIVKEISVIGNKKITIVGIDGLINSILLDQNVIGPLIKLKDKNLTKCDNKLSMQYIFKQIEDGAIRPPLSSIPGLRRSSSRKYIQCSASRTWKIYVNRRFSNKI